MNTGVITISGIETKEGATSAGKPWRLFKVVSSTGQKYSTFDSGLGQIAAGNVGKSAEISYEATEKGNDLKTLTITGDAPPSGEPVRDRDTNGNADWDMIGLRKTRCALWAAILANASFHDLPTPTMAAYGRELVIAAEVDIFHRSPANDTDDLPF